MSDNFSVKDLFYILIAYRRMQKSVYDSKQAWEHFNRTQKTRKKYIFQLCRIAAVLIITFIPVYFVWHNRIEKEVGDNVICRYEGYPVLTLTDGRKLVLTKDIKGQLYEKGVKVSIEDSLSTLQYAVEKRVQKEEKETYNSLYIPKGGEYSLTLSDGTKVWLNSETRLTYPVEFFSKQRIVKLEGEAYFEVASDSCRPFWVEMSGMNIEVLGTKFNISCYESDRIWHTTLVSGKVKVSDCKQEYTLVPGMHLSMDKETAQVDIFKVNPLLYSSWKEGRVVFHQSRLEDIIRVLSRWYDFEVFYVHPELKDWRFGGAINKYNSFEVVLRYLERTAPICFDIKGKTVLIKKK